MTKKQAKGQGAGRDVRGAIFYREGEGVSANAIIAELRGDGRVSKVDPRKPRGFGADGVVGVAVHVPRGGYYAVVDSADGSMGIGAGEWSRVAMTANHLGTEGIWYRRYSDELALAVTFARGSSGLTALVGYDAEVVAALASQGIVVAEAVTPHEAGADAVLVSVKYAADKYRGGPDASVAAQLRGLREAIELGDAEALRARYEALGPELAPLSLGVVRSTRHGEWERCLRAVVGAVLAVPARKRLNPKQVTLDEEALRSVAVLVAPKQGAEFLACLDRLDVMESDAEQRSDFAHTSGIAGLAYELERGGNAAAAHLCYQRLVRRDDAPHWMHVDSALRTMVTSQTGPITLTADAQDLISRSIARGKDLGAEAQDAVYYNLACVYGRAGRDDEALSWLSRCPYLRQRQPPPSQDRDLERLWQRPEFLALFAHEGGATSEIPVDELELSVRSAEALAELGLATLGDVLALDATTLPARVRAEVSELLADEYDLEWGKIEDETGEGEVAAGYVIPPERAVPRQDIVLTAQPGALRALVSRIGGLPNVPASGGFEWPDGWQRPMQLVFQLVGKAAGGEVDLGDVHVLQAFADLDGDYYEDNEVLLHREACVAVAEAPPGITVAPARVISLSPGSDDRLLVDLEDPYDEDELAAAGVDEDTYEAAYSHAFCDKLGGLPVGANLDPDQRDSRGEAMNCLVQLMRYDDWFFWYLFVSRDFSEARLEIVRG